MSVTASVVRYETLGKKRTGVTTTFLCDRFDVKQRCPVFINKNPEFRYFHVNDAITAPSPLVFVVVFFITSLFGRCVCDEGCPKTVPRTSS